MAKRAPRDAKEDGASFMGRGPVTAAPLPKVDSSFRPPVPLPLSALLGQDRASGILVDSLRSDRVHHAWIFHGPAGVGKCTAAAAFASLLLDPTTAAGLSGEIAPDPESTTQQMLSAGTHPDFHYIAKELATYSRLRPHARVSDRAALSHGPRADRRACDEGRDRGRGGPHEP
jgi:hypothetical protein